MLQKDVLAKVTKKLVFISMMYLARKACNFLGKASLLFTGSICHHIRPCACFELPIACQKRKILLEFNTLDIILYPSKLEFYLSNVLVYSLEISRTGKKIGCKRKGILQIWLSDFTKWHKRKGEGKEPF